MGTPLIRNQTTLDFYAERVAEALKPMSQACNGSLRWYCFSNELSLCQEQSCEWAYMAKQGIDGYNIFKHYHDAIRRSLDATGLSELGQLATDAAGGFQFWRPTMDWAATNSTGPNATQGGIQQTVAAWGGHDYADGFTVAPDVHGLGYDMAQAPAGTNTNAYYWHIAALARWGGQNLTARTRADDGRERPFIFGEVGSAQRQPKRSGGGCMLLDTARYFDSPSEPFLPLQMAEMAIAATNYSANALAYWSLADSPPNPDGTCNRWGAFRWTADGSFSPRFHWFALGPLVRAMRGPASTHVLRTADSHLRAAALRTQGAGQAGGAPGPAWTVTAVLRRPSASPSLRVLLPASALPSVLDARPFRLWVYDPVRPPANSSFADLPPHSRSVSPMPRQDGAPGWELELGPLPANSLVVATQAYSDTVPGACRGLQARRQGAGGSIRVQWDCLPDADGVAYYRVVADQEQKLSTVRCGAVVNLPAESASIVSVSGVNRGGEAGQSCSVPITGQTRGVVVLCRIFLFES